MRVPLGVGFGNPIGTVHPLRCLWGSQLKALGVPLGPPTDLGSGCPLADVQPPEGKSRECLLTIVLRDGSKTTLCAESEDDAM